MPVLLGRYRLFYYSIPLTFHTLSTVLCTYRPFHKTLPRSSAFVNWISVRFYETGCTTRRELNNILWDVGLGIWE